MQLVRTNAILPFAALADADFTGLEGKWVEADSASGRVKLITAANARPLGVIIKGVAAPEKNSIAINVGLAGTVRLKLGADVAFGAMLKIRADATCQTAAFSSGEVIVGVALEAGVTDELIEAALSVPLFVP